MDRRSAMFLTLLGGLVPRGLLAQSTKRRTTSASSKGRGTALEPSPLRRSRTDARLDNDPDASAEEAEEEVPPNLPAEPGQQWRNYDISHYTSLANNQNSPQNAIIEWIFRRTTQAEWHGDKIAVLSASRAQVRAYNNANVLKKVDEVIERFTNAQHDILSIRIRFVAAVDSRWRYAVYSRLTPVGSGPQGQQVWTLKTEDSAFALAQMQIHQGFKLLTDQKVELVNGQTLVIKTSEPRGYTGGLQRESAAGLGYQPRTEQLEEGITLKLSPLLTFDGDALDAAIELTANTVKNFHRTRVIAPREVGPSELTIDVPEVTESRLNQTVKSWPLKQTLLISAGIQPGILQSKSGLFNLRIPGTVPTGTELLVFLEAEAKGRTAPDRDRE
ncbi:hypothetical protein V5E97_00310 [Singulisphaera sp. Ch08]|uniref:Uncharacterized protein n=1 Tax=Singulisphaera sp. Ch08 TaxID=3120278 RepID=A0AAU7CGX3_9BACT